jgi:thioredoxin 2
MFKESVMAQGNGKKLTCLDCGQLNRVPEEKLGAGPKCGTCGADLMPGKAVAVDASVFAKAAKNDEVPLVVDFWAPWCGPCKMMAPEFSKAASALRGKARLVKLNTEEHQNPAIMHGIRGIPTMVEFKDGKEVKRQSGAMPSSQIMAWIQG